MLHFRRILPFYLISSNTQLQPNTTGETTYHCYHCSGPIEHKGYEHGSVHP